MQRMYGEAAPSYDSVKRWSREFRCGRTNVEDQERSGRPKTAKTEQQIAAVKQMVLHDRRITIENISEALAISAGSVHSIIHEELGMDTPAGGYRKR